ncbi:hypothetical protein GRF29_112g539623 [Pseudopithomyces chartarum]|uniref:Extracellular membrane protein CFEM domain-containing protein n=1 Tax=Pseudopithomyces chartarum TaxID=1892770 RepID=A0AAN6LU85_9PLEO|nr:hypothetical protein GRF29_112g539623 [Pseudopithomyces chartarum]
MPTLLSTITSILFVTLSVTAIPQNPPDIPSAIRGLSDCTQDVLFPLLANSQCNPANFPCICIELDRLQARATVADACPDDVQRTFNPLRAHPYSSRYELDHLHAIEYNDFALNTCGNIAQVVTITDTSVAPITVIPVIITTAVPDNFTAAPGPFNNGTAAPVALATTLPPIVVVPSREPAPAPEPAPTPEPTEPESTASPAEPVSPANPEFSGAAVSDFGKASMAGLAGGLGVMWLAFAQL